jgi:hypothetical protein
MGSPGAGRPSVGGDGPCCAMSCAKGWFSELAVDQGPPWKTKLARKMEYDMSLISH